MRGGVLQKCPDELVGHARAATFLAHIHRAEVTGVPRLLRGFGRKRGHPAKHAVDLSAEPDAALEPLAPIFDREFGFEFRVGRESGRMKQQGLTPNLLQRLRIIQSEPLDAHASPAPPKRSCHSAICSSVILANRTSGGLIFWPGSS